GCTTYGPRGPCLRPAMTGCVVSATMAPALLATAMASQLRPAVGFTSLSNDMEINGDQRLGQYCWTGLTVLLHLLPVLSTGQSRSFLLVLPHPGDGRLRIVL
ncbi:unnamed protein product, partial [Darwinula stevensoni]